MKQPSYKNFFLNVDRKVIYFIWVRLKCRKKKLKQRLKKVYQIYSGIIRHDGSLQFKIYSHKHKTTH